MGKDIILRLFMNILLLAGMILNASVYNEFEEVSVGAHSTVVKIIVAIIVLVFLLLFDKYMYREKGSEQRSVRVKIRSVIIYAFVYLLSYALFGLYCFNVL